MAGASGNWGNETPWKKWWEESLTKNLLVDPAMTVAGLPRKLLFDPSVEEAKNLWSLLQGERSLGQAYEASPTMNMVVDPLVDAAMLPGDVYSGEIPIYDEFGEINPEIIERSTNFAGTIPLAGLTQRAIPNVLASGPVTDQFLTHAKSLFPMSHQDDLLQNVKNYPENWALEDIGINTQQLLEELGAPKKFAAPPISLDDQKFAEFMAKAAEVGSSKEFLDKLHAGAPGWDLDKIAADVSGGWMDAEEALGIVSKPPTKDSWAYVNPQYQEVQKLLDQLTDYKGGDFASTVIDEAIAHYGDDWATIAEYIKPELPQGILPQDAAGLPMPKNTLTVKPIGPLDDTDYIVNAQGAGLSGDLYNELENAGKEPWNMTHEQINEFFSGPASSWQFDPGFSDFDDPEFAKLQAILTAQSLWPGDETKMKSFLQGLDVEENGATFNLIDWASDTSINPAVAEAIQIAQSAFPGKPEMQYDFLAGKKVSDDAATNFHISDFLSDENFKLLYPKKKTANEILKPKPLQPGIAPWAKMPAVPKYLGNIKPGTIEWNRAISQAYREDLDISEDIANILSGIITPEADNRIKELYSRSTSDVYPDVPYALSTSDHDWLAKAKDIAARGFPEEKKEAARALGFDPEQIYWKGTRYPEHQFLNPATKPNAQMLYFSDKPDIGQHYGHYIYPTVLRMENPAVMDLTGTHYEQGWMQRFVQDALAAGHDSAIARNMDDAGGLQDQFMISHPSQVRSIWAQFDPGKKASSKLLAAELFGFNPLDFFAEEDEEFPVLKRPKQ